MFIGPWQELSLSRLFKSHQQRHSEEISGFEAVDVSRLTPMLPRRFMRKEISPWLEKKPRNDRRSPSLKPSEYQPSHSPVSRYSPAKMISPHNLSFKLNESYQLKKSEQLKPWSRGTILSSNLDEISSAKNDNFPLPPIYTKLSPSPTNAPAKPVKKARQARLKFKRHSKGVGTD
mmetsp:Transcript_5813/g.10356  ORF Transcript_5813/g.10356 Transcript_5813/m.10356 type:complete len:175 (+) Transcript_5813:267-791(+)